MGSTRAAAAHRRQPAGSGAALGLRLDRLGRVALVVVLGLVMLLYIGPAHSLLQTWQTARSDRAQVRALAREHAALLSQQRALRDPRTIERDARALGMVAPGERSYVLRGLPR
jgi:cell division protein FtsB